MSLHPVLRPLVGMTFALTLLAAGEGALQLLEIPDRGLYTGDLQTVWWLRDGLDRAQQFPEESTSFQVQTNDLGLRGMMPPPTGRWTLALGCSTTFGWGVEAGQAWPAIATALLDEPVINGGVPGWSTHQARAGAERWLALEPDRVILGYIVRDAQPAAHTDAQAQPTPWLLRTQLARLLRSRLTPSSGSAVGGALPTVRVPPEAYRHNLRELIAMAGSAEVVLLAFPQQDPAQPWRAVLESLEPPLIAPELASDAFFDRDPIHLNAAGHEALAAQIAAAIAAPAR